MSLYAKWTPAPCTVHYISGHGTAPAPVPSHYGARLAPQTLSAVGYVFLGWHTDAACTPDARWDFATDTVPAVDILMLYANWAREGSREARFDLNAEKGGYDGDASALETPTSLWKETGDFIGEPAIDVEGWYVKGWYKDAEGSTDQLWDFRTDTMPGGEEGLTLYAQWERRGYAVDYDMNGYGYEAAPGPVTATYGALLAAPDPEPSVTGRKFTGWYTDESCTRLWHFDRDTMPARNLTLYAKWVSDSAVSVDFVINGHGGDSIDTAWYDPGAWIDSPPEPSLEGYSFEGWFRDEECTEPWIFEEDTVDTSIILYARWIARIYEVRYDTNGYGDYTPAPVRAAFGTRLAEPSPPSHYGYVFGGWYTDELCSPGSRWNFALNTVPATDIILYAKWTIDEFTVTYDANGHGVAPPPTTAVFGTKISIPPPPFETGYIFGGWFKNRGCTSAWDFAVDTMPGRDLTLYAKWTVMAFTVTYDANGHGAAPSAVPANYGSLLTAPEQPYEAGYDFGGWFKDKACDHDAKWDFASDTMPDRDIVLYAKWTVRGYTVTYDANGHGEAPAQVQADYGTKVEEPSPPAAEGYDFGGWFKDEDSTSAWDFAVDTMPDRDITLYAKWTAHPTTPEEPKAEDGASSVDGVDDVKSVKSGKDGGSSGKSGDKDGKDGSTGSTGGAGKTEESKETSHTTDVSTAPSDVPGSETAPYAPERPDVEPRSIINLVLTALGILLVALVARGSKRGRKRPYPKWAAPAEAGIGVLGVALYFVLEPLNEYWVMFNGNTPLFAAVFAAATAVAVFTRRAPSAQ
jgi:uncharacterized repeat protein (TIGR02543 family)